jgi:hypothetical protein
MPLVGLTPFDNPSHSPSSPCVLPPFVTCVIHPHPVHSPSPSVFRVLCWGETSQGEATDQEGHLVACAMESSPAGTNRRIKLLFEMKGF